MPTSPKQRAEQLCESGSVFHTNEPLRLARLREAVVTHGHYKSKVYEVINVNDAEQLFNWETEGAQFCHEAEGMLLVDERKRYITKLRIIVGNMELDRFDEDWSTTHATYEQRLEALCRVWFPEQFTTPQQGKEREG